MIVDADGFVDGTEVLPAAVGAVTAGDVGFGGLAAARLPDVNGDGRDDVAIAVEEKGENGLALGVFIFSGAQMFDTSPAPLRRIAPPSASRASASPSPTRATSTAKATTTSPSAQKARSLSSTTRSTLHGCW